MFARATLLAVCLLAVSACTDVAAPALRELPTPRPAPTVTPTPTATPEPTPSPTPAPTPITGVVLSAIDGTPLAAATVTSGDRSAVTEADGRFELARLADDGDLIVTRPAWQPLHFDPGTMTDDIEIELDPLTVRGLRVSRQTAGDPARFEELLSMVDASVVNTLVFDTKDEEATVLYETDVPLAAEIGAINAVYDPTELLRLADERGLYTVTRIVTFEDSTWARGVPEAKLIGSWVDATDPDNWEYPLDLAVEACEIGFDEIQFDYVRYPAGELRARAGSRVPATSDERAGVIADFLAEARARLSPLGCGLSAAVFGIVMSSADDEGIGQTPEAVSPVVDAISPMLYPSHYSPGWLGFADPNDHPGPVVAHSLDRGLERMTAPTLMRPWIQGFYYRASQVKAQIEEAERRGAGWIIWNFHGDYRADWLPVATTEP
jgi:hypothetical protein